MMRALADGRVRWGFWPAGGSEEGKGIWLDSTPLEEQDEHHSGSEGDAGEQPDESEESEESESEESEDEGGVKAKNNAGFFAALDVSDDESEEEEGSDSDE